MYIPKKSNNLVTKNCFCNVLHCYRRVLFENVCDELSVD